MIQGYVKSRFDRELDDEDVDIVAELLVGAEPPIETREDPRFADAFRIIDGAESVRTSLRISQELRLSKLAEEGEPPETWELWIESVARMTNAEMRSTCESLQEQECARVEQLVYHYTDIDSAKLIVGEGSPGFRASTVG